jgi:HSP20 family protein
MTDLNLWRKQEFDRMRKDIDLLFRRFRRGFGVPRSLLEPATSLTIDIFQTEATVILRAELPGMKPEDILVSVTDDSLTLKGTAREEAVEKGDNYERVAQSSRSFSKTISLPCRIMADDVKATYRDGILEIVLPKCKPQTARGVQIEMK